MRYYFAGGTGHNTPKSERLLLSRVNTRLHEYSLTVIKNQKDMPECIRIIKEQIGENDISDTYEVLVKVKKVK